MLSDLLVSRVSSIRQPNAIPMHPHPISPTILSLHKLCPLPLKNLMLKSLRGIWISKVNNDFSRTGKIIDSSILLRGVVAEDLLVVQDLSVSVSKSTVDGGSVVVWVWGETGIWLVDVDWLLERRDEFLAVGKCLLLLVDEESFLDEGFEMMIRSILG
jgi:hypothetical protein